MKSRTHCLTIVVHFDKPCTIKHAVREVRDTIHGEFYPTCREDDEPETYRVRSISSRGIAKLRRKS
jgi:hypothetical protein